MPKAIHSPERASNVALSVRERIERGGERLWRLEDFDDLPFTAVAQALSRLKHKEIIQRLSKGVYYRARPTSFGSSRPNPATLERMALDKTPIFSSGLAAASLLGFTTQTAKQKEVATHAGSLPRKLIGGDTIVHTRRPDAWARLSRTMRHFLTSCAKALNSVSCRRKRPSAGRRSSCHSREPSSVS